MTLLNWQQRVVTEEEELGVKINALANFIDTDKFLDLSQVEQGKLVTQAYFMTMYAMVLDQRMDEFPEDG